VTAAEGSPGNTTGASPGNRAEGSPVNVPERAPEESPAQPSRSSNSLRPTREVRTDASLGRPGRSGGATGGLRRLRSLTPSALGARAGRARFPLAAPNWPESVPRPAPTPELGVHYDTGWARRYPVRLARAVVLDNVTRPLAKVIASPQIRGEEALRDLDGPIIFASNHVSHADTPLLLSCLPLRYRHRTVVAAAADYFFDRRWKADTWSFLLAAIPIERTKINRRSVDLAAELLEDDWNLVIFPEGGRSPDGWGQTFHPGGAAYLATRTGAPVVPVHLDGTRHLLPKGRTALRRTRTTVTFGTPLRPDEGEHARQFSVRIETAVATMADEATTDWWTARTRAAQGTTPPLQGPATPAWRRAWALSSAPDRTETDDGNRWPRRAD
jgi:1-acyl-sn-glycerol-3-phosphate acyltransferase